MMYLMKETELRQWEPLQAAIVLALTLGMGIGLQLWGITLLGAALALSLLRDAALLRRRVRQGRIWICEGRVQAAGRDYITLRRGNQTITLALHRPLAVHCGDHCHLALERGTRGYTLLGVQRRKCALRLIAPSNFQPGDAMLPMENVL